MEIIDTAFYPKPLLGATISYQDEEGTVYHVDLTVNEKDQTVYISVETAGVGEQSVELPIQVLSELLMMASV